MHWGTAMLLGDAIDLSFSALDKGGVEDSVVNDTHFSSIATQGRQCQHHCCVAGLALG